MLFMKGKSVSAALAAARFALIAAAIALFPAVLPAQAPDGKDILKRMDQNGLYKSLSYEATLTITSGKKVRVKSMRSIASGDSGLVEFTNPEDRGVKYLKIKDELWIYFPEEDDTVRISGTQLKEGFMGSDISYGDVMDVESLLASYAVTVEGSEVVDGRDCWVLSLTATAKTAPYDRRKMWVDAERYIALREEMSSKTGVLLKSYAVSDIASSGGRWYARRFEMRDARKKDSLSVFEMSKVAFDVPVDESLFSLKGLRK